jgi:hypothetical protein
MRAVGWREAVPLDLFVVRRPPQTAHFASQRVRQAYDEWARPRRLATQLAILPGAMAVGRANPIWLLAATAAVVRSS